MADYSKEAGKIVEKHINEIDEDDFEVAFEEALEKNLLDELLDLFEKAGIRFKQDQLDHAKEKHRKRVELSAREKANFPR